jgi:hypothetical protein
VHEKKPVGEEYLERWSGYSFKTIDRALGWLSDPTVNLVTRVSTFSWQLTGDAMQLPLMQTLTAGSWNYSDSSVATGDKNLFSFSSPSSSRESFFPC